MSEVVAQNNKTQTHQTIYLKNYQPPAFLINETNLQFDLNDEQTVVKATLVIKKNAKNEQRDLVLNGEQLQLINIAINGIDLSNDQYSYADDLLVVRNVPDHFELEIVNYINPKANTALSGLYKSGDAFCTQCEAEGFRRITFYLDRPDVLSVFSVKITADKQQFPFLLSNGNLIEEGDCESGRHFALWQDPFKKPCYLFALVAGDFDLIEDNYQTQSGRTVDIKIYTDKGLGNQAGFAAYSLKQAMRWDEEAYGREYDLDIYMIAAMSDFNMGAMENKGLNIFNTKYVLAKPDTATDENYIQVQSVIGHEYFHNWTGNRVTCRDWFQLSLKEGLTIFRDQSFSQDMLSYAFMRINDVCELRESQFIEDAGPLAHPVRPESYIEINNFYTSTVYNKGAEVLRMLASMIGKDVYSKAMDLYFTRFDGQAVTIDDYVNIMQEVSGVNLEQFRLWYSQAGTPHVIVDDDYDGNNQTYTLRLNQSCAPTPSQDKKQPFHIPVRLVLLDKQGKSILLKLNGKDLGDETILHLTESSQSFCFEGVTEKPVPSLLRDFSAPVKLSYDYSNAQLLFLYKHDTDAFNRWEAGQRYMLRSILNLARDYQQGSQLKSPDELIDAFNFQIEHAVSDLYFLNELLTLPSENYISEQMEEIDVEAIHAAREFLKLSLAKQLKNQWLAGYRRYHLPHSNNHFSLEEASKRKIKNTCLGYLMMLDESIPLALKQFDDNLSVNMTDTLAAFNYLADSESKAAEEAVESFYKAWRGDALVLDKWFAVQASSKRSNTLQVVKDLMRHPDFNIKNPNKVYALIASFAYRNLFHFHARNGEGYAFLAEVVQTLDSLNPQIAARMVKPLTRWRRYDKERQALMCERLRSILQMPAISPDLYEVVSKSLM